MPGNRKWTLIEYVSEKVVAKTPVSSDVYVHFINQVAKLVEKTHPDVKICFSSYLEALPAPLKNKPGKNTSCSCFALFWRCYHHYIKNRSCKRNAVLNKHLLDWRKKYPGTELIIYEYFMGVMAYLSAPFPITSVMAVDIPYLADAGVAGIATQAEAYNWNAYNKNFYLLAKRSWDAAGDLEKIEAEFLDSFYRNAAKPMKKYHKLWSDSVHDRGKCFYPRINDLPKIMNSRFVGRVQKYIQNAKAVAEDKRVLDRLAIDEVILQYTCMMRQLFIALRKKQTAKAANIRLEVLALARKNRNKRIFRYDKLKSWSAGWFKDGGELMF